MYGAGSKGKATRLHSLVVRARGRCQYPDCGSTSTLQAAHIISRRYNAVRTDEHNAWCLCAKHHFLVDSWAVEKSKLIDSTIGGERYEDLRRRAMTGVKASDAFWQAEIERLTRLLGDEGLAA